MRRELVAIGRLPESLTPPSTLFAFIWHFMRQIKWLLLVLLLLEVGTAGGAAMIPIFLGRIVNALSGGRDVLAEPWLLDFAAPLLVGWALCQIALWYL